ncbi:MAG: ABC transporter substrate-binding protein [Sporichthyaceae bacterium]
MIAGWPRTATVLAVAMLGACGTRVDEAEVRAAAGLGEVTLAPASIDQLRAIVAQATPLDDLPASSTAPATVRSTAKVAKTQARTTPRARQATDLGAQPARSPVGAATAPTKPPAPACTKPGAPVVLGQVGNFSGVVGPVVAAARATMAVWAKDVNARGGLACHPVTLYQRDDGLDQSRSAAAIQELVQEKKAVAIIGAMAIITMAGFASGVERMGVPAVGGDGITLDWDRNRYLYRAGAPAERQVGGLFAHLVADGATKLGYLYCIETPSCTAGTKVLAAEAERTGAELVYQAQVSASQTEYSAQCLNARNAGVQAIYLALDGASIARVARSCATVGYHPRFASSGGVISGAQARDSLIRQNTFVTTSPTAPWMLRDSPGQRAFHDALTRYAPGLEPDSNAISAWTSGKLLEAAVAGLGPSARTQPLTTATILAGLATVREENLGGLTPPLTFETDRTREKPPRCVYLELLTTAGWTAPRGNRTICT